VVSACVAADVLLPTVRGVAAEIAAKSTLAVRAAERSFNVTEDLALRDAYRFEQSQTVVLAASDETKEAQRAFAEKRKPVLKD
jgi:enoyl-CoA hydratase/carnithine racemase